MNGSHRRLGLALTMLLLGACTAGPNASAPSLVGRVIQSGTAKSILMTDELT